MCQRDQTQVLQHRLQRRDRHGLRSRIQERRQFCPKALQAHSRLSFILSEEILQEPRDICFSEIDPALKCSTLPPPWRSTTPLQALASTVHSRLLVPSPMSSSINLLIKEQLQTFVSKPKDDSLLQSTSVCQNIFLSWTILVIPRPGGAARQFLHPLSGCKVSTAPLSGVKRVNSRWDVFFFFKFLHTSLTNASAPRFNCAAVSLDHHHRMGKTFASSKMNCGTRLTDVFVLCVVFLLHLVEEPLQLLLVSHCQEIVNVSHSARVFRLVVERTRHSRRHLEN